jgi:signal transduction histidine kinase
LISKEDISAINQSATWRQRLWRLAPTIVICCLGVVVTTGVYMIAAIWERDAKVREFNRVSYNQAAALNTTLQSATDVLRSVRGLYTSSSDVTREEFRLFATSLELRHMPQVRALEWVPRISHQERLNLSTRPSGAPSAPPAIRELGDNGELVTASVRPFYYPVMFVEPREGNERAIGFDLGSDPIRAAAIELARDTGHEVASERVTLVQGGGGLDGVLIFMPIYGTPAPPDTVEGRRKGLRGYALGIFDIDHLIELDAVHPQEIDVALFDRSAAPGNQILFSSAPIAANTPKISYESKINFAGRAWSLVITPAAHSELHSQNLGPKLAYFLGLTTTLMLALYLHATRNRNQFAQELVKLRTQELETTIAAREAILTKLKQTNKDLEAFAFVASHDLKAPLRGIDNLVSWIVEDTETQLSEESENYIERMQLRIRRLEKLLDDLLEYARFGYMDTNTTMVDAQELCEQIVDIVAPPESFDIQIDIRLAPFETVKAALQTTLTNLISNAVKHHDQTDGRIRITATETDDAYEFTVSDDGPGIEAAHHQRIFEIFQTLTPRSKVESTGIGLSVVARLVAAAGGTIRVVSEENMRGTSFIFTWNKEWVEIEDYHAA